MLMQLAAKNDDPEKRQIKIQQSGLELLVLVVCTVAVCTRVVYITLLESSKNRNY